ncbi:hypothetical protein BDP27DRAFT_1402433 [Rhodocollybia butyracea]|uniref:Uncharacterized protein n=1 Tax=Rhodocollybia butyracea TaxID=206335 RepID=A0A9P5U8C9_9AGAR|nr:hypothetical protein BDP27DRAFT_1402433 [Rhodocollybia butyracea]
MSTQSSQSSSPRITRSPTKDIETVRLEKYIAAQNALPTLPARVFYFKIFKEEDDSRSELDVDGHNIFEMLASMVLTHLTSADTPANDAIASLFSEFRRRSSFQADEVFEQNFGKKVTVENLSHEILRYLETNRPTIIFVHLKDPTSRGTFIWDDVPRGGDNELTNEMFLSLELMEAILGEAPPGLQEYLFRNLRTPILFGIVEDHKMLMGGAGTAFEFHYLGFVLEMVVNKKDNVPGSRMWCPDMRMIACLRVQHYRYVLLDPLTIQGIYQGFSKPELWSVEQSQDRSLPSHDIKADETLLRRCSVVDDEAERKSKIETELHGLGLELVSFACGRHYKSSMN